MAVVEKMEVKKSTPDQKQIPIEQAMGMFQDQLTLLDANTEKTRQRILDQIFTVIGEFIKMNTKNIGDIKKFKDEIDRLQRLCKEHNIDFDPPKKVGKNRKERRAEKRKKSKSNPKPEI